jgi:DHA1 family inner membrane transport protein
MSKSSVVRMTTTSRHEVLPDAPATATTALPWRHLAVLSFAAFWTVTLEMLPAGLLPQISRDLDVRPARVGLLVTVWAVTVGLSSLPLTRLTRSWQRPTALAAGLAVLGVASAASAVAPTFAGVLAARLVAATGHGLFWSVLMVYAASLAPAGREARAISVVLAGPVLAGVAGLPVGTLLGGPLGWRWVVGSVAVSLVVGAVLVWTLMPTGPVDPADPAATVDDPSRAPRDRVRDESAARVWRISQLGALALVAHFGAFTYIAPLVDGRWSAGVPDVGVLLLAFGIAGAVGLAPVGLVADQAPERVLLFVVVSIALTFWLLAVTTDAVAVLAAVVVWGLLIGALPPALQSAVIGAASPAYRNTAGAVLVAVFNLGIAFGAAAGGVVIEKVGLGALLPLTAAVATVSAVGLAASSRRSAGESLSPPARP